MQISEPRAASASHPVISQTQDVEPGKIFSVSLIVPIETGSIVKHLKSVMFLLNVYLLG